MKRLFSPFVGHMLHDFAVEQQILERLVGEITVRATSLSKHNSVARAADFRIRRTIHYIRENPAHQFDTAELAAISGLSVPHFFERFKECTGVTPGIYVKVVKMERAFNALTSGELPHRQGVRQPRFQGTEPFHPLLSRAHRHHAESLPASVARPGIAGPADYPGAGWIARYRERVNSDRELSVIGDWFTTSFALTFGDARYALKVEKGKIVDIIDAPSNSTFVQYCDSARRSRCGKNSSALIPRRYFTTSSRC